MGDASGNCQPGVRNLGKPHGGLVCIGQEPQAATVRGTDSGSQSSGGRRIGSIRVNLFLYAFLPVALLPLFLRKLAGEQATVILIAPPWPKRSWFLMLLDLIVDSPRELNPAARSYYHRVHVRFTYTQACSPSRVHVVDQSLLESGFSLWAAATIARPQRASTLAPYEDKWSFFCGWCGKRSIDPLKISVNQLAEFLLFLFHDKEFSPGTVAVIVLRSQLRLGASGARILVTMLHFRL